MGNGKIIPTACASGHELHTQRAPQALTTANASAEQNSEESTRRFKGGVLATGGCPQMTSEKSACRYTGARLHEPTREELARFHKQQTKATRAPCRCGGQPASRWRYGQGYLGADLDQAADQRRVGLAASHHNRRLHELIQPLHPSTK
jgi:hypothetical protein